jgi:hypothetical protein
MLSARTCCKHHMVIMCLVAKLSGCGDEGRSRGPVSKELSLAGVTFHIPDDRALVLPSTYVTRDDIRAAVGRVSNFTFCAEVPQITLRTDPDGLRACIDLGVARNNLAVVDVSRESLRDQPPPLDRRPAEGFGLAPQLQYLAGLNGAFAPRPAQRRDRFSYAPAGDRFGLKVYEPRANIDPGVDTIFWHGASIERVTTLISCSPYLPEQIRVYKWPGRCQHEFLLPSAMFGGHTVKVTIHYTPQWLERWEEIETNARHRVLGLRVASAAN